MAILLGDFVESLPTGGEYASVNFSFETISQDKPFLCHDLSFGIVASYVLKFIRNQAVKSPAHHKDDIKETVDYIINELLENSIKYGDQRSPKISIQIHIVEEEIFIIINNALSEAQAQAFQDYAQRLVSANITDLYLQQLEENIDQYHISGIGLLSIIHDYKAKVGWKFELCELDNGSSTVMSSVMVQFKK